jgi:hypothetical protein
VTDFTREEANARFDEVLRAIGRVYEQLAELNDRTRKAEVEIARLDARIELQGSTAGGIAGGVVGGLFWLVEWVWRRIQSPP